MSRRDMDYTIDGTYIDLEREIVLDSQGRRIDQAYVDQVVEAAHAFLDRENVNGG